MSLSIEAAVAVELLSISDTYNHALYVDKIAMISSIS